MRTLAIITCFISFSAIACPNLSGVYKTCSSKTGVFKHLKEASITQTLINETPVYVVSVLDAETDEVSTEEYKADGKIIATQQAGVGTTTMASCTGNSLTVERTLDLFGTVFDIQATYSKVGNTLMLEYKGMDLDDTIICE